MLALHWRHGQAKRRLIPVPKGLQLQTHKGRERKQRHKETEELHSWSVAELERRSQGSLHEVPPREWRSLLENVPLKWLGLWMKIKNGPANGKGKLLQELLQIPCPLGTWPFCSFPSWYEPLCKIRLKKKCWGTRSSPDQIIVATAKSTNTAGFISTGCLALWVPKICFLTSVTPFPAASHCWFLSLSHKPLQV